MLGFEWFFGSLCCPEGGGTCSSVAAGLVLDCAGVHAQGWIRIRYCFFGFPVVGCPQDLFVEIPLVSWHGAEMLALEVGGGVVIAFSLGEQTYVSQLPLLKTSG